MIFSLSLPENDGLCIISSYKPGFVCTLKVSQLTTVECKERDACKFPAALAKSVEILFTLERNLRDWGSRAVSLDFSEKIPPDNGE